ncbi:hypothetical protein SDC9_198836 [bioreactor metagenome]|uniref:Uncharacterized protein n=1 Tax=bioreactor metagenome TaxID=1076179 RepID=A0A645IS20_9ZZZZ
MREHEGEQRAQGGEFLPVITEHFIQHGFFAVHNLVMRIRQDIVFGKRVQQRKGNLVVVVPTEQMVHGHIFERVVHKPHIPFEGKPQSTVVRRLCNGGIRGGFLRNRHAPGKIRQYHAVELL